MSIHPTAGLDAARWDSARVAPDLALAFRLADLADTITLGWWMPTGVAWTLKDDGSPVTAADLAAEEAVLDAVRKACPDDAFVGEEVGEHPGTSGRRWIVDGIDGTRLFAAGRPEWGSLIALECDGDIILGVSSSPAQGRRWWATRGGGAFAGGTGHPSSGTRIQVSTHGELRAHRVCTLPGHDALPLRRQHMIEALAGGRPRDAPWSHQNRVAEGEIDLAVWFCGDIWDHAAPSILVEEAGGRFSDHQGGRKELDHPHRHLLQRPQTRRRPCRARRSSRRVPRTVGAVPGALIPRG